MTWGWQLRGACTGNNTLMFFAPDGARGTERVLYEAEAKEFCRGCPVRVECLEAALDGGEYGVWGGTNEQQRTRMRRDRARTA